jgi:hypothetical protein
MEAVLSDVWPSAKKARGLTLGLSLAGTRLTAIVAPALLSRVIPRYGWRASLREPHRVGPVEPGAVPGISEA